MKRRRGTGPSLFHQEHQAEYLVDTSSWIALAAHDEFETMWPIVSALIAADRLFSPSVVIGECISVEALLAMHVERLRRCDRNDVDFLLKVGTVARKYRRLSKPDGSKTKADPFLIALAILDGYTIVAEETLTNRAIGKIPGVCAREHLRCVTLAQMLDCERGAPKI